MWKKINSILHDKNDYHLDPQLQHDDNVANELLQATIRYQKYLIPKKIKYFFQHDKSFFLKLFGRFFFKILIGLIILSIITFVGLRVFNVNINFKKIQKPNLKEFPIYIPSTDDPYQDSINIRMYNEIYDENYEFILFYMNKPEKNFEMWKERLQGIETGGAENPYATRRTGSQYWGKYQMGESARKSIGLDNIDWEQWSTNPELQEAAFRMWVNLLHDSLKKDIERYDGKFLRGWSITESGIIAMAHNVGVGATRQFLQSGGSEVPQDGSGKDATRFLILGNYDLGFDENAE